MTSDNQNSAEDDICGLCPECNGITDVLNIGRNHWAYCDTHRITWWIGSNLFSSWHNESEDDWARNREFLAGYRVHDVLGARTHHSCAVLDPVLGKTNTRHREHILETFAPRLQVVRLDRDGYGVIEIPEAGGTNADLWGCGFASERAAKLFRNALVEAAMGGNVRDALCSSGVVDHYNLVDRLIDVIERCGPDPDALAQALAEETPWLDQPFAEVGDVDLPF